MAFDVNMVGEVARMATHDAREVSDALMHEHPTMLGQLAKAVGLGVMKRTLREETYRPYDNTLKDARECAIPQRIIVGNLFTLPAIPHPEHDGRLDCATVIGAELMSRQSFI